MPAIVDRCSSLVAAERAVPPSPLSRALPESLAVDGAAGQRLELTSRGDRVPAALWQPPGEGSAPLVVLQYGAGGEIGPAHLATVTRLVGAGLAVVTVDWPLHGARRSPKLSERLLDALERGDADPNGRGLIEHFLRQCVLDLSRTLDRAGELERIDATRVGLLGSGLAAPLLALLAAVDPRPSALALAPPDRPPARDDLELSALLAAGKPRPTLLLGRDGDAALPPDAQEALCQACPGEARWRAVSGPLEPLGPGAAIAAVEHLCEVLR